MTIEIPLRHGGAYTTAINRLRNAARGNGTQTRYQRITVTHPQTSASADLWLNLANDCNRGTEKVSAALYVVAFGPPERTYHFTLPTLRPSPPGTMNPWGGGCSYRSLGYTNDLPALSFANLHDAVASLAAYRGMEPHPKAGLARLLIAVSEAMRMSWVEQDVESVLRPGGGEWTPDATRIRNWGGWTLG